MANSVSEALRYTLMLEAVAVGCKVAGWDCPASGDTVWSSVTEIHATDLLHNGIKWDISLCE